MRPILNPDCVPKGDMFTALNWLETKCRLSGKREVTEAEVICFLTEEEKRPDLAEAFATGYLCPLPDASR